MLIFVTEDCIAQYDTKNNQIVGQESLTENAEVKNLIFGFGKIAIICANSLVITNKRL